MNTTNIKVDTIKMKPILSSVEGANRRDKNCGMVCANDAFNFGGKRIPELDNAAVAGFKADWRYTGSITMALCC
jgi:hypothetical protein